MYAIALFTRAGLILVAATLTAQTPVWGAGRDSILFFLLYGLFTISIGYPHPSIGLAQSRPELAASEIVDIADQRLYAAKNSGRNLVIA